MRIFITGGTGFIGTYLVKHLLNKKHKLLILSRKPKASPLYVYGDLSDFSKWSSRVKRFKPEAAVHLAWEDLPNYKTEKSIENLNYGLNLYNFLAKIDCQLVLTAGTGWEYGAQKGKLTEDNRLEPLNAFIAAKIALCFLGQEIAKENDMRFIWVRIFYVYGTGQRETSLIPSLINFSKIGKTLQISNLNATHDFIYVEDVAEAISIILNKVMTSNVFNIGSGKLTSVKKIIAIVENKLGLQDNFKQLKSQNTKTWPVGGYADISKVKSEVGWQPKTNILEGVEKTIINSSYIDGLPSLHL